MEVLKANLLLEQAFGDWPAMIPMQPCQGEGSFAVDPTGLGVAKGISQEHLAETRVDPVGIYLSNVEIKSVNFKGQQKKNKAEKFFPRNWNFRKILFLTIFVC